MLAWKWAERRQMVKSIREIPAKGRRSPPVWDIKIHWRATAARAPVAYGPVNIDWYFNYPLHNLIINHKQYSFSFRVPLTGRHWQIKDGRFWSSSHFFLKYSGLWLHISKFQNIKSRIILLLLKVHSTHFTHIGHLTRHKESYSACGNTWILSFLEL